MNARTDTTEAASPATFPIPYPSQASFDDFEDAMSMLRVVMELMGDGRGFDKHFSHDLNVVICAAKDRLEPILIHLRDLDMEDRSDRYNAARREWIAGKGVRP